MTDRKPVIVMSRQLPDMFTAALGQIAEVRVAGETPDDAIRAVEELNAAAIYATLDHLGEHTTSPAEAEVP